MLKIFKDYINKRVELVKMDLTITLSRVISFFFITIFSSALLMIMFMFLTIALVFFLGDWLGSYGWAFLLFAGIYLILFIIFLSLRKKIERYFFNKITEINNEKSDENEGNR